LRSRKYHLMVQVENDEKFESIIAGRPDVRTIRVITDKAVYRPSEIVLLYPIQNPDGFELTKKSRHAKGRFITTEFQLPEHLNFGEWEIVARALEDLPQNSFSASFDVQDYDASDGSILKLSSKVNIPNGSAISSAQCNEEITEKDKPSVAKYISEAG
uniref:DUF4912 domain-containing protein n=1 Tax=Anisakis simplex TaxID=6269 RepID=A0A0M3KJ96_ANISI